MSDVKTKPVDLQLLATIAIDKEIATPQQGNDVCHGVPYFDVALEEGKLLIDKLSLIHINPTILLTRYNASLDLSAAVGICGPAFALKVNAQGALEDVHDEKGPGQKLTLKLSEDETLAGFFFGAVALFGFDFEVELLQVTLEGDTWHKHFETHWVERAGLKKTFALNLLKVLFAIIKEIITRLTQPPDDPFDPADSIWREEPLPSLSDKIADAFKEAAADVAKSVFMLLERTYDELSESGQTKPEPSLAFNLNILPLIEGYAETEEALKRFKISLAAGPSFELGIPVDVELKHAYVNCEQFSDVDFKNGTLAATRYGSAPITSVDTVALGFDHTPGIDFRLGFFVAFTWLKFCHLEKSITLSLGELFGFDLKGPTYKHAVDNNSHIYPIDDSGNIPCQSPLHHQVEILFEEPG